MARAELIARLQAVESAPGTTGDARGETGGIRRDAALSDSEERLRSILETAVEGIITIDERGRVESMNAAAEKIFGYRAEEVIGRNISMLMPSPYREAHDGYLRNYMVTGKARIIGIGREVIGQRRDGTQFPLDLAVSEVKLATRRLFTGFVRDITDRKEAEKTLSYYAAIVESSDDAIMANRMDGLITSWNRGAEMLLGYSREAILGAPVSRLIPGDRAGEEVMILERIQRGESLERYETARRRRDGTVIDVAVTISPIREPDGSIIGASTIARDITARKRGEERLAQLAQTLAEKNKELETIVYIASHDLRSPLVNIQGFSRELAHACELLRSKLRAGGGVQPPDADAGRLLDEDIPEALEYIQAGVTKIDTLLSGFLRYSRLGRAALKIERLDMNSMMQGITQAMEFQIKRAGARVQAGPLPDAMGDATLMTQVFSNLLENAVKYLSPKRAGTISVTGVANRSQVIYTVRDNGVGIAPEHQAKIFEIFHRLKPDDTDGEGLGLTIAQRILERHGGRIWLESEPDRGTAFFVSLVAPPQARSGDESGT